MPRVFELRRRSKFGTTIGLKRSASLLLSPNTFIHFLQNRGDEHDMNVRGAWEDGYSGLGIVVTILDDGLEKDHPDLAVNYVSTASVKYLPRLLLKMH